jgi:hypothetical protein
VNDTYQPRKIFPPNQLKFREIKAHVLDAPKGYAKAYLGDQTPHIRAGIAVDFRNEFGNIEKLKEQNKKVGETAVLKDKNGEFILYMVAKRNHYYKPIHKYKSIFKSNFIKALYKLRKTCLTLKINKLAIAKMWCNSDMLSWEKFMKPSYLKIFDTVPIELLMCDSIPGVKRHKVASNAVHIWQRSPIADKHQTVQTKESRTEGKPWTNEA